MSATNILIRKRITTLLLVVGLVLGLLIGRLAWIQFVRGEELQQKAKANRMDDIPVPAKRGALYDRNGRELVISISSDSVCAFPPAVKAGDPKKTAEELARVLAVRHLVLARNPVQRLAGRNHMHDRLRGRDPGCGRFRCGRSGLADRRRQAMRTLISSLC